MLFVKLFVHFECYACVGREEEFWYKFALQHKGIRPFLVLIVHLGFGLGKWTLMKETALCYTLNLIPFFIQFVT